MTKKTNNSKSQVQGHCIFCQGTGMTKQHIWPNWISRTELAADDNKGQSHERTALDVAFGTDLSTKQTTVFITPKTVIKQGTNLSQKLRMVCRSCNGGWMSQIEDKSKSVILDLQSHADIILSVEDQRKLVAWIALMTIISEFTDMPYKAIPSSDRKYFYENKIPPSNWEIWIGKYAGQEWKLRYSHKGLKTPDFDIEKFDVEKTKVQWQSSTFVVGGLMMHVISTSCKFLQTLKIEYSRLTKIWPPISNPIHWHDVVIHDDSSMNQGDNFSALETVNYLRDFLIHASDKANGNVAKDDTEV